jgi:hypothetical protein
MAFQLGRRRGRRAVRVGMYPAAIIAHDRLQPGQRVMHVTTRNVFTVKEDNGPRRLTFREREGFFDASYFLRV